jgi:peptidoglycan/xylan/chitin deacetylase (PgdA/CDA1 family)
MQSLSKFAASVPGEFALCLTHDVDRPFKTYQAVYDAVRERSIDRLRDLRPGVNPYWQFETITDIEDRFGVRSAFYFLTEPPLWAHEPRSWFRPKNWIEHLGRYDLTASPIRGVIPDLDDRGWEIGLHGSRRAASDPERFAAEKRVLESVLGHEVRGCRHHHMTLDERTWDHHRAAGLTYDATLGDADSVGFQHGYYPLTVDDGRFLVFPLTAMEVALPDPSDRPGDARAAVDRLLETAARHDAVMTVLWHPRYFSETEFPGYRSLYRYLLRRAVEADAWVGSPGELIALTDRNVPLQSG